MAVSRLQAISNINPDLSCFCQARELNTFYFFPSLWESILELLLINNYTETALSIFLNTLAFFRTSYTKSFSKRHKKFIIRFTNTLLAYQRDSFKKLLHSAEFFNLLEDFDSYLKRNHTNLLWSVKNLLEHCGIMVVEKKSGVNDVKWGNANANFSVFLLRKDERVYFLHQKTRLRLKGERRIAVGPIDEILRGDFGEVLEEEDAEEALTIETASTSDFYLKKRVDLQEFCIDEYVTVGKLQPDCYCGAYLCMNCGRKLKRSTFFLINSMCCPYFIYNSKSPVMNPVERELVQEGTCYYCQKPSSKKEKIECMCCFLNRAVYENSLKLSIECKDNDAYFWVDITYGNDEDKLKCGFCDRLRHKLYMCLACHTCGDQVCLACLRKNPYITEGTCSNCNCKRMVTFKNI